MTTRARAGTRFPKHLTATCALKHPSSDVGHTPRANESASCRQSEPRRVESRTSRKRGASPFLRSLSRNGEPLALASRARAWISPAAARRQSSYSALCRCSSSSPHPEGESLLFRRNGPDADDVVGVTGEQGVD